MSALIQLGLSHLEPEAAAGELGRTVSVDARSWLDRFRTADEWLKKVFEGIEKLPKDFKDAGKLGEVLESAAPWIEAGSKAFPPAHLLFEVVSKLTKINDPGPDGHLLATDSTALLRRITEITIDLARFSTDHIRVGGS